MNNQAENRLPGEGFCWAWRRPGDTLWQFDGNREFPPISPPPGYEQITLIPASDLEQVTRERDGLRKALERAADDLRDIGNQSPRPSNSSDPSHENYLRRVLISLAQTGNTRARAFLNNLDNRND